MAAVAAADAGAVLAVGGQHVQAQRLVQADIAGEGAVAGGHQHLLPVARIAAAAHLQVAAPPLQGGSALQQAAGGGRQFGAAAQPVRLGAGVIAQGRQALKATQHGGAALQPEHAQGLVERFQQAGVAEVVGAHEAVAQAAEHAQPCSHTKGRTHAGDAVLFSQHPQVIGALQEHLHKISAGGPTGSEQGFQPAGPVAIELTEAGWGSGDDHRLKGRKRGLYRKQNSDWEGVLLAKGPRPWWPGPFPTLSRTSQWPADAQRTEGWNCSLRIGFIRNSWAICTPLAIQ